MIGSIFLYLVLLFIFSTSIYLYITLDLISYKDKDRTLIRPKYKHHFALFEHCTGGLMAVTPEFFNDSVKKLLIVHSGKHFFNIKEESSK